MEWPTAASMRQAAMASYAGATMSDLLAKIKAAVPPGYRAVDFRDPETNEHYLTPSGEVAKAGRGWDNYRVIILERDIEWPPWIKSGCWVVQSMHRDWFVAEEEPKLFPDCWRFDSSVTWLMPKLFDLSWLPANIEWKESKRQKP